MEDIYGLLTIVHGTSAHLSVHHLDGPLIRCTWDNWTAREQEPMVVKSYGKSRAATLFCTEADLQTLIELSTIQEIIGTAEWGDIIHRNAIND